MKRKLMLLLTCLFIGIGLVTAQVTKVTGVVTSEEDGLPVVGASILVKGTTIGTVTDMDGKFTLSNVPSSARTLMISFIGMKTVEVAIKPNITVSLHSDTEVLDEVVVTGYGSFKKSSFTGAASTMSTDKLQDIPTVSVEDKLSGSVAGVQLNSTSGQPGAAVNIKIRGVGSMNAGNNPLFVIDGVPMVSGDINEFSYSNAGTNLLSTLNSNDIESMTIIKDAAAASLYGSRAANGVVVITTKKGSAGKTKLTLKSDWGFSNTAINYRPTLNGEARRDLLHLGLVNYAVNNGQSESDAIAFADRNIETFASKPWSGYTDWADQLLRTGSHQNYEISAQGGSEKTRFYSSLAYTKQDGVTKGAGLERMTGNANVTHTAGHLTIEVSTLFSKMNQNVVNEGTSYANPYMSMAWTASPSIYPYEEDGSYSQYFPLAGGTNPVQNLNYNYNRANVTRTFNTMGVTYNIWDNLNIKELVSYDYTNNEQNTWWDRETNDGSDYNGLLQRIVSNHEKLNTQTQLTYNKTFNAHNIDVLLGFETEDFKYKYIYASAYDYPGTKNEMINAGTRDAQSYSSRSKMTSFLGRLNYNYNDKYYISASFRRDGTSRLARENRWGDFWSVSASWRFMQEDFMKSFIGNILTDGKLRLSYGVNGTLPSDYYGYMTLYQYGYKYNGLAGMAEGSAGNTGLKWEKNKAFNIGLDLTILDRLSASVDYYTRNSSDLLMDKAISYVPGLVGGGGSPSALQNVGKLKNSGIEVELRSTNIDTDNWTWTTAFTISHNKNKLVKLDGIQTEVFDTSYGNIIHREGETYNSFWAYEYAGVDPATGMEMYYINDGTENGRNTTTDLTQANRTIIGNPDPKVQGGLTNFIKWKFIDVNLTLTYQLGGHAMDYATWMQRNGDSNYNYYGAIPDYYDIDKMWKKPGDVAEIPQFVYGNTNYAFSSRWMMSTDYLRVKNLAVGLTLPVKCLKNTGINKARVYFAANNLLTWKSKDMVVDPETPESGMCRFEAPAMRTYTFGIEIGF